MTDQSNAQKAEAQAETPEQKQIRELKFKIRQLEEDLRSAVRGRENATAECSNIMAKLRTTEGKFEGYKEAMKDYMGNQSKSGYR